MKIEDLEESLSDEELALCDPCQRRTDKTDDEVDEEAETVADLTEALELLEDAVEAMELVAKESRSKLKPTTYKQMEDVCVQITGFLSMWDWDNNSIKEES